MKRLQDKTILITAAGQGIGRAAAELCVAEGAIAWATDLDASKLNGLDGCQTRALDVLNADQIENLVGEIGPIDALFNCAGFVANGTALECTDQAWELSLALNVTAMFRLSRQVLPGMIERGGGSIINMSSVASSIKGVPNRFAYGTTKAAVIGLTKSIAADFVSWGVRCNAICPGTVDTPSLHERLRATGDYEAALAAFKGRQPMGRIGNAEEIAALVLYLASDEAAYVTGQTFVIDGGWSV